MDDLCDQDKKEEECPNESQPVSTTCLTYISSWLKMLLQSLIPSFLKRDNPPDRVVKQYPTAYLDGIRGVAAFAVFLCHLSYGTWDVTHVFGAGGAQENRYILQLPIIRLMYGGPPMVAIFFVISGYALSYKHHKLMLAHDHEGLMLALSSSVFRRAIRLFLPCFVSTFLVALLCQLGAYKRTEEFAHGVRANVEEHAWTAPNLSGQIRYWAREMIGFVNVFDWSLYAGSTALDRHLWTIPAEYRCSIALFMGQILMARMTSRLRLVTLLGLIWWGVHWNRWELVPFWAGSMLAESDLLNAKSINESSLQKSSLDKTSNESRQLAADFRQKMLYTMNLVCGLYLASFPDADGHVTPGYMYLNSLIPKYWTEKHRFWPSIAAVQIVWSVSKLKCLRCFFSKSLLQYFGRISFPLYVVHGPVIHTFGYMTMNATYSYTGIDDRLKLSLGFGGAAIAIIIVVVWVSDIFWRVVDRPSIKFAKWLEKMAFVS